MGLTTGLSGEAISDFVRLALREDVGRGDLTTAATVDVSERAVGRLEFRSPGVVCGLPVVEAIFRQLDATVAFEILAAEGSELLAPMVVMRITCTTAALLSGERVALNIIARMAGIATLTRRYVARTTGTNAKVLDTRKTTPGLRALEKYAVRVGGGRNHRMGLDDGVLIKDNHVALAGGVAAAVTRARSHVPPGVKIEVEVESLAGLEEALAAGADIVLLDNMRPELMREAVRITAGRIPLEASGGITLETVRAVADTGVDYVSAGALTHSALPIDVGMEIDAQP
jgi:nicotinate-nucleotide pyrophosphorylase (carboxylating)